MRNDILIIVDSLVEPPSETYAFRTVTMIAADNLKMDVLLHSTQNMKDLFYNWMKPKGMMDYVKYILTERESEDGIRIDVLHNYPRTIIVESIRLENQLSILGQLKMLTSIE